MACGLNIVQVVRVPNIIVIRVRTVDRSGTVIDLFTGHFSVLKLVSRAASPLSSWPIPLHTTHLAQLGPHPWPSIKPAASAERPCPCQAQSSPQASWAGSTSSVDYDRGPWPCFAPSAHRPHPSRVSPSARPRPVVSPRSLSLARAPFSYAQLRVAQYA